LNWNTNTQVQHPESCFSGQVGLDGAVLPLPMLHLCSCIFCLAQHDDFFTAGIFISTCTGTLEKKSKNSGISNRYFISNLKVVELKDQE